MKYLADENVHSGIVAWLRGQGLDVKWSAETQRGWSDADLLSLATREQRIIITDDLDFGDLVFHQRSPALGVVILRLQASTIAQRLDRLNQVWAALHGEFSGRFVVITKDRVRVRALPFQ